MCTTSLEGMPLPLGLTYFIVLPVLPLFTHRFKVLRDTLWKEARQVVYLSTMVICLSNQVAYCKVSLIFTLPYFFLVWSKAIGGHMREGELWLRLREVRKGGKHVGKG